MIMKFMSFLAYLALAGIFAVLVVLAVRWLGKQGKQISAAKSTFEIGAPFKRRTVTADTVKSDDNNDTRGAAHVINKKCAVAVNILNEMSNAISRIVVSLNADEISSVSGSVHEFESGYDEYELDGEIERIRAYSLPALSHTDEISRHHIFFLIDAEGRPCFGVRSGTNPAYIYNHNDDCWEPADVTVIYEIRRDDRIKIGNQVLELNFMQPGIRNKRRIVREDAHKNGPATRPYEGPEKKPGRAAANVGRFIPPEVFERFADRT